MKKERKRIIVRPESFLPRNSTPRWSRLDMDFIIITRTRSRRLLPFVAVIQFQIIVAALFDVSCPTACRACC
jgi:hypothetical protein